MTETTQKPTFLEELIALDHEEVEFWGMEKTVETATHVALAEQEPPCEEPSDPIRMIESVKEAFDKVMQELSDNISDYLVDPNGFSRKGRISLEDLVLYVASGLNNHSAAVAPIMFSPEKMSVTASAYLQKRDKIKPEAFSFIFHRFTELLINEPCFKVYQRMRHGYRPTACDGSAISLLFNAEDSGNIIQGKAGSKPYCQMHGVFLYDILNGIYLDYVLQDKHDMHERQACMQMVERSHLRKELLLVCDRGFEGFEIRAYLDKAGIPYVIRCKPPKAKGMLDSFNFEGRKGDFYVFASIILTKDAPPPGYRAKREWKERTGESIKINFRLLMLIIQSMI